MITRVFRARINPEHRAEFEAKFSDISIKVVEGREGFVSVEIGKPTRWAPDEYVMISRWEDEEALVKFVGENWNRAHIPQGMEHLIAECWVHHYRSWDGAR